MKGMILAAGLGSRLHPLTLFRPKPAIPFLNRPLIQYSLDLLHQAGIQDVIINTHHQPDEIRNAAQFSQPATGAQEPVLRTVFSHEPEIQGTAGAIARARDFLSGDTFVVCNGKIYFEERLTDAIRFHQKQRALVTLVLVPHSEKEGFNPVFMDEKNRIAAFRSPQEEGLLQPYTFTGVQILDSKILDFLPERPSDTINDVYPGLIEKGHLIAGFVSQSYWCECSTPQRYLSKSLEILKNRGLENLTDSPIGASCQGVVAGHSVRVEGDSCLENSILWNQIGVGRNCSLRGVIVADGVDLAPATRLSNAIVTPLPERADTQTAAGARLHDNCLIWPL